MWASTGKVYVLGGMLSINPPMDHAYSQDRYFFSWDIAAKKWSNEGEHKGKLKRFITVLC